MKVLITDDQLDSLLSIKISSDGGKTYTDYNVSSLKDNGTTFDCSPNNLKVICDTNILNYIKVFADGEKLNAGSGGGDSSQTTVTELSVTENGTYNAGSNAAYNPVIVNVPSVVEDKLLCYYKRNRNDGSISACIVYTDKPATRINFGNKAGTLSDYVLPIDDCHMFFTNMDIVSQEICQLVYEDGTTISLKDKFIYIGLS